LNASRSLQVQGIRDLSNASPFIFVPRATLRAPLSFPKAIIREFHRVAVSNDRELYPANERKPGSLAGLSFQLEKFRR
jgi:hypothetical protein